YRSGAIARYSRTDTSPRAARALAATSCRRRRPSSCAAAWCGLAASRPVVNHEPPDFLRRATRGTSQKQARPGPSPTPSRAWRLARAPDRLAHVPVFAASRRTPAAWIFCANGDGREVDLDRSHTGPEAVLEPLRSPPLAERSRPFEPKRPHAI